MGNEATALGSATGSNPRRRRVVFALTAIALSLTVTCLALEVAFRLFGVSPAAVNPFRDFHCVDTVLGARGRPHLDALWTRPEFTVRIVHDERGFRRHKSAEPTDPGARSIHVFGDSFTWGWGVDHGEVFTDRWSELRPDCRVRNYGLCGTGTATHYRLFHDECRPSLKKGDDVVVAFYTNDFADCFDDREVHAVVGEEGIELRPAERHRNFHSFDIWLRENSYLCNWISHHFNYWQQARRNRAARAIVPEMGGSEVGRTYYRTVEHCLRLFRDDCRAKGARFAVLSIPEMHEIAGPSGPVPAREALAAICRSLGIPLIDPTDALLRLQRKTPAYIHADGHWTAAAHREIARLLSELLAH